MENQKVSFKKVATITLYAYIVVLVLSAIVGGIASIFYNQKQQEYAKQKVEEIQNQDSINSWAAKMASEEASRAQHEADSIYNSLKK